MITLQQAKNLKHGDELHHETQQNMDGSCQRWRVSGKPKTWITRPGEIRVPVKHGFNSHDYLTHVDLDKVHLTRECPYCFFEDLRNGDKFMLRWVHLPAGPWVKILPREFIDANDWRGGETKIFQVERYKAHPKDFVRKID